MGQLLKGKARERYIEELSDITCDLTGKIVSIADKYCVDRNNAMQHFSEIFSAFVSVTTFEKFEPEGGDSK